MKFLSTILFQIILWECCSSFCPPGSQVSSDGQNCNVCPEGHVKSEWGNSQECTPCQQSYHPNEDFTQCVKCIGGYCKWSYYITTVLGNTINEDGQILYPSLSQPNTIALGKSANTIIVSEFGKREMNRISLKDGTKEFLWDDKPYGLKYSPDYLNFYYSIPGSNVVIKRDQGGTISYFVLSGAMGIAVDLYGNLMVASISRCNLFLINQNSGQYEDIGSIQYCLEGSAPKQTRSVAITESGEIFATEESNAVRKISADYTTTSLFTPSYMGLGKLEGIVFDNTTKILYVVDRGNKRLVRLTSFGVPIPITMESDNIKNPVGIDSDENGNIYFADSETNLVRKIYACPPFSYFVVELKECKCVAGFYPGIAKRCAQCPAGLVKPTPGNFPCISCMMGEEADSNGMFCQPCPSGKTRPSITKYKFCFACPENSICDASKWTCKPGFWKNSNNDTCVRCSPGSFRGTDADDYTCLPCPDGTQSSSDYSQCEQCPQGTYRPPGYEGSCIDCPPGAQCTPTDFTCLSDSYKEGDKCVNRPIYSYKSSDSYSSFSSSMQADTSTMTTGSSIKSDFISRRQLQTLSSQKTSISSLIHSKDKDESNDNFGSLVKILLIIEIIIIVFILWFLCMKYSAIKIFRKHLRFDEVSSFTSDDTLTKASTLTSMSRLSKSKSSDPSSKLKKMTASTLMSKTSSHYTHTAHSGASSQMSSDTLVGKMGLSIPGFLLFNAESDFEISESVLGKGGSSTVRFAKPAVRELKQYGNKFVVKEFTDVGDSEMKIASFFQEVSIMFYLREHPNIAKIMGYTQNPHMILIKYYPMGDLNTFLKKPKCPILNTTAIKLQFVHDIARGMEYMINKGIAHCDVKPLNILVDINLDLERVKTREINNENTSPERKRKIFCVLADFGLSCPIDEEPVNVKQFRTVKVNGGSIKYASPELLIRIFDLMSRGGPILEHQSFKYDPSSSDIYALSVVICDILNGLRQVQQRNSNTATSKVINEDTT